MGGSEPGRRRPQVRVTWLEPGEWTQNDLLDLRSVGHLIGDRDKGDSVLVAVVDYAPHAEVPAHSHLVDYISVVVRGSIEVTKRQEGVGSIRIVRAGTGYGPLKAGPEGCTAVDIFALGGRGREAAAAQYLRPAAAPPPPH